jgi:hypothetical protein
VPLPGAFKAVNGEAAQPADARVADAFPQLTRVPHVALQATGGPLAAAPGADRSLNVGVVLSGGQAPGACSAVVAANAANAGSCLLGSTTAFVELLNSTTLHCSFAVC